MDLESTTDILTESKTHLSEVKFYGLTHKLICKALQVEKC